MGVVLRYYNWEAYYGTDGRCTAVFPFLEGLEASKAQRYKWGAYCGTNWRCAATTFSDKLYGLGVPEKCPFATNWCGKSPLQHSQGQKHVIQPKNSQELISQICHLNFN